MQKLYFFLIILFLTPKLNGFNFSQELRQTSKITDTFDLIATYQIIANSVEKKDSARLSKKFLRMIKTLHEICSDNEDSKIKSAFKNLLETTIANEKLKSVDYFDELSLMIDFYSEKSEPVAPEEPTAVEEEELTALEEPVLEEVSEEPEIFEEQEPEVVEEPEVIEEITVEPELTEKEELIKTLKDKLENLNKSEIIHLLSLKKLTNQVEYLREELKLTRKEIAYLTKQNFYSYRLPSFFDFDEGAE